MSNIRPMLGRPGFAGPPGRDAIGIPGRDGVDGKDGRNGLNGRDGKDGINGIVTERTIIDMAALEQAKASLEAALADVTKRINKIEKRKPESSGYFPGGDGNPVKELTFTFDNGASALNTGQALIYYTIPYDADIKGWSITGSPSGSISIDVWKAYQVLPSVANSITGGNYITLSSQQINGSTNLTGWATSVRAGEIFELNINSAATLTRVCLVLKLLKR